MKTYTYYFKAIIKARSNISAQRQADDHINGKYKDTMEITDSVDQDEY